MTNKIEIKPINLPEDKNALFQDSRYAEARDAIAMYGKEFIPNFSKKDGIRPRTKKETTALAFEGYFKPKDTLAFIATKDQAVIGVINMEIQPGAEEALIGGLVVKNNVRNEGVGTELLSRAMDEALAKGCESIRANVVTKSVGFFEERGLQVVEPVDDNLWTMQTEL